MNLNDEITALNKLLVKYGEKNKHLPLVKNTNDAKRVLNLFAGIIWDTNKNTLDC